MESHSLDLAPGSFTSSTQITCNNLLNQSSKPTSQFFQCKFCVRYFRSKSLLNDHTRKVHAFVAGSSVNDGSLSSAQTFKKTSYSIVSHDGFGKVFSCQYCTYKSPRRARILKHQKMYHKYSLLDCAETGTDSSSIAFSNQEPCAELPEEVVQRSVLESMVKPLTKSRGNFTCEWCGYQTLRRERWCDHMMKKHRNMVKVISSLQQEQEGDGITDSYKSASPPSPRNISSSLMTPNPVNGNDCSSANSFTLAESSVSSVVRPPAEKMESFSCEYSQIKKTPSNTGASILSDRSTFLSDMSNSGVDFETSSMIDDSRSSSEGETEEMDDATDAFLFSGEKQLLSEEDHKMLETKGILFKRHMNRFKCPFCPFLTTHHQSISRHIENFHCSGKTSVYKCGKCPFICTNSLKLDAHKQSHVGTSSAWENMDKGQAINDEPMNGGNVTFKMSSKIAEVTVEADSQTLHHCSICSFTTATLKGLRVHQQHKHSFCDSMQPDSVEISSNELHDSECETYSPSNFVQKTQTSILGYSSKKHFVKTARKSINDTPLDLSPVKKRTRIDEIAKNLQSKISQSTQQEDSVINVEEMDDDEENVVFEIEDREDSQERQHTKKRRFYRQHSMYPRKMEDNQEEEVVGRQKPSIRQKPNSNDRLLPFTLSDEDNENEHAVSVGTESLLDQTDQDSGEAFQNSAVYSVDPETLFYCKHCDYHNKSARSVSTHYQRMHPYIKFNFRYILDPEDQSAVFRCLECYVEYTTFDDLNQHYSEHHPEAINVLNFNQPDLVYKCRFCFYTSPNVRSLMPHYQRMHPTVKINNAMIFSSYVIEPRCKESAESQTLREILNSGPKSFTNSSAGSKSSACFSPGKKNVRTQDYCTETDFMKETTVNNIVVYDCDICSFASPNMHSVLVHYQKKHPEQKASYFRIQKTMRVVSVDRSYASNSATPDLTTPSPLNTSTAFHMGRDEDLFYCKHCVYSNRSVVGVLVHYQKRHPEIKVNAKYIKQAAPTPGLMKLMEELQIVPPRQFLRPFSSNGTALSCASQPRTSSEKGEVEMFFCQHCDYGNRTVKGVLIHYQKKHRDVRTNADSVRRHTAAVRCQRERAQSSKISSPASTTNTETTRPLRALKCRHCSYTSPYVYALKKHLKKEHPTVKATAMTILRWAYQDGILEAGYHCEWCIYSHAEPNGLLMHYQRRHPEHNVDYTHMATKLWAGPDSSSSQPGVNSDLKHYRCRDCAFEACSIWDITNHYQVVHPWAIKGDESVLLDIIKGNPPLEKTQLQLNDVHVPISGRVLDHSREHGQEASDSRGPAHLSFASTSISNNPYRCTVCLSEYNSLHGLLTHYGKKHPGMKVKAADFAQETDINPSSVYKCRHCPYINSRIHGVLTHYQKRHPHVKVTAEDFADDIEEMVDINEGDEKYKSQRQGYGAYRCKMCSYSHGTLEKLKVHYEKYHNQPASDMFQHSLESGSLEEVQVEGSSADIEEGSDLDPTFSQYEIRKDEKHSLFRCQLCRYFCSTRKGIARHYRVKHNNVRAQPEGMNNVFKCSLCSYTNPIRKGLAAHYQKRHDIDAYYTHCLAASKTFSDKPNKVVVPMTCSNEGSLLSEELRLAVERRKCSLCSFQAFSRKSIVSHYIKRHPGVFPKKQHSSKLGRYFTVVYAKESDNISEAVDEHMEEPSLVEQKDDLKWLPFKCSKCFKLSFNTAELLCMHYTDHHSKDLKRDFSTLTGIAGDSSECYQCTRCDLKFLGLQELSAHLTNHNEDFQKKAERQERRKQLGKHKGTEQLNSKPEKLENHTTKAPVGYRCNFCVEVHPTLRAICNHLRKHVQYGEAKAGHVKQEVTETPVSIPDKAEASVEVAEVESVALVPSPVTTEATSATTAVATEPEQGSKEGGAAKQRSAGGHPCRHCDRVLMSMQGLRSHERSHSAMAVALSRREDKYSCQYCHFISPFRHNLYRHIQSNHGQHKLLRCKSTYLSRLKSHLNKAHAGENTYRCLSCLHSFTTISRLKEHCQEAHGETLTLPKLRAAAHTTLRPHHTATVDEKPLINLEPDRTAHAELLDNHQHLSEYQQETHSQGSDSPIVPTDGLLVCELCEFSSDYMEKLCRHYHDHHSDKKLHKCKDCSFFTSYKSTFLVHMKAGHSVSTEEGHKDLRCPLCLYRSKVKSSMIDHIVLHREERMVPLEVCRSKLSRHLQGVVFRCHKCTFTCSSDESLKQHLQKHSELKPYKCQLCFYDSREYEELEAHLRDEHKVICNFELAGQVNLDQLEAMKGKLGSSSSTEEEEEPHEEAEGNQEVEEEKESEPNDTPSSPGSAASTCGERRFPCQFCGRVFTDSTEWERHVLRHGMVITSSRTKVSHAPAIQASSQSKAVSPVAKSDGHYPGDSMEVECDPPSDQTKSQTENMEEEKMQKSKNCP
ncbi:zinc finger protein 462-like isoform X2 [Scleropages formosus]|uniref:zinc finger protein 462-like isoform X2 n=1 Tax=Scleropages formosus TaxID=113540 RepID=UPI000877FD0C|nr:zinc finger protein 462-like isoform X2 [Scleropages formosus]